MPSKILDFKTPIDVFQKYFPNSRTINSMPLKIFGCTVFIKNPNRTASKLDPKGKKCVFLGVPPTKKGYKCFDPSTKKMFITMDVAFFENEAFFDSYLQGETHNEDTKCLELDFLKTDEMGDFLKNNEDGEINPNYNMELTDQINDHESQSEPPHIINEESEYGEIKKRKMLSPFDKFYTKRNRNQEIEAVIAPTVDHQSEPEVVNEKGKEILEIDLPIALRKEKRSCTMTPLYPMSLTLVYLCPSIPSPQMCLLLSFLKVYRCWN